jgi:hypothetical protein
MTPAEMKVQKVGLTLAGLILAGFGIVLTVFLMDMSDNALMGASPKYKANIPAVPATDVSQAPQCVEGYDKNWIGCQKN